MTVGEGLGQRGTRQRAVVTQTYFKRCVLYDSVSACERPNPAVARMNAFISFAIHESFSILLPVVI